MIPFLIILFIFLVLFILVVPMEKYHKNIYMVLGMVLIFTAGLRAEGITMDYDNYLNAFYNADYDSRIEPTFLLIANIVKSTFNDSIYLFFIYAILGVSIKFIAFKQLSNLYLFSAIIYLSNFFILHEMTQIRAGVASGILLLCIKPIYERNLKIFLIYFFAAIMFHYSAAVILFLWFLNPASFNKKNYLMLLFMAYLLAIVGFSFGYLVQFINFDQVQTLYSMYNNKIAQGVGESINIFNSLQILRILILVMIINNLEILTLSNKYIPILTKIYVISLCSLPLFADIPAISFRVSELLGVVEIILIPYLMYLGKLKKISIFLPITVTLIMLLLNLFYINLIIQT